MRGGHVGGVPGHEGEFAHRDEDHARAPTRAPRSTVVDQRADRRRPRPAAQLIEPTVELVATVEPAAGTGAGGRGEVAAAGGGVRERPDGRLLVDPQIGQHEAFDRSLGRDHKGVSGAVVGGRDQVRQGIGAAIVEGEPQLRRGDRLGQVGARAGQGPQHAGAQRVGHDDVTVHSRQWRAGESVSAVTRGRPPFRG
jgi:hypothetical protein